ncbi:MAG TPA: pyridoxal-phosphate dependent enzyme [Acidimicrobiales bacterium]|nr:pyridoxal-phosphate dependent enzyme [Acidimicrobiales bacterium]
MTTGVTGVPSRLICSGCGAEPAVTEAYPFRCPNAGRGDVDHVLARVLDPEQTGFPGDDMTQPNPFIRYRGLLHSRHRALAGGLPDRDFVGLVEQLDTEVARVDGRGFRATPFARDASVSDALGFSATGGVWVKDETGNVAGSHKGRHLMGVMLHLEVAERVGLADPDARPDLAIASCGNAALAAAVLAAAAGRVLRVFVPAGADTAITTRLGELGAQVVTCPRPPGAAGDPTYLALRQALDGGAIPFTCQGNENGLVIEGGETLGYEMVTDLRREGTTLDHLVVQVGGGALASACIQALDEAAALGALAPLPRVHTVQTAGAHPLERAYHRVRALLPAGASGAAARHLDAALATAASHRSRFMWPWEDEPASIATGILDDETYDWLAVVRGMLATDGRPVVVDEATLAAAHGLAHAGGHHVCATGSSGLAGLMALMEDGTIAAGDRVAVLFTGADRS